MDDMIEVPGVSIAEVESVGTAENGEAYVGCRFADDSTGIIAFPQGLAQRVSLAFLEAAGLLDDGQCPAGRTFEAVPVREATVHLPVQGVKTGEQVLTLTFESGRRFNFLLPPHSIEQLAWEVCQTKREIMGLPPLLN